MTIGTPTGQVPVPLGAPARGKRCGLAVLACVVACLALRTLPAGASARSARSGPAWQVGASPASPGTALADIQVFLMTFGPGRQVWERFGHNAIWVHDPASGTDEAYNYGLFDFHQENFVLRFVRGQMWYWMAGFPAPQYIDQYERDNRSVWVQELDLTPGAKLELQRFLQWNAEPEHRFYHYDYYRDNCSTRVRDAIDRVIGGSLRAQTAGLPAGTTFRFHTQRLTSNDALVSTGLLLALGEGVDRPISAWQEMFLPLKLREYMRRITVPGPDGTSRPLVRSERTLFESSAPPPPNRPPSWLAWYLALGSAIGGAALALAGRARDSTGARFGFIVVAGGWAVIVGLAGMVLAGLWGLTDHVMAYRNENLLQMNPLALAMFPGIVGAARRGRAARRAVGLGAVVVAIAFIGLVLKMLPGFDQVNGPIIALALPAHVGVAAGLVRLGQAPRVLASPSRASG